MWSGEAKRRAHGRSQERAQARYQRLGHLERYCSTAWRMQEGMQDMHSGWKKIIVLRHLQWKGKVCLITISKILQSSGWSPRKKGGIGSRTDPCFGSDIFYTSLFYLIELLKNIMENVSKKETNKIRDSRFRMGKIQYSMDHCYY